MLPASRLLTSKNPLIVGQIAAYNSLLDRLAAEMGHFQVVHPFQAMPAPDDLFIDGYHLNDHGAHVVVDAVEPIVRDALTLRHAA